MRLDRLTITFIMTVILLACANAHGQRAGDVLPEPINSADIDQYVTLLKASPEQRVAMEPMHEAYLTAFAEFRTGKYATFMDEARSLQRDLFRQGGVERAEEALEDFEKLARDIERMDASFFTSIDIVLSDEQRTRMPRVQGARARQRVRGGVTSITIGGRRGAQLDLAALVLSLPLESGDAEEIDPLLASYEQQLLTRLTNVRDAATEMFLDAARTYAEMDTSDQRRAFTLIRDAFNEAMTDVNGHAEKLVRLNRDTERLLADMMSPNGRRALRRAYLQQAYTSALHGTLAMDTVFRAAIISDDIDPSLRDEIHLLWADTDQQLRVIEEQIVQELVDQRSSAGFSPFGGRRRNNNNNENDSVKTLQERLVPIQEQSIDMLGGLIGTERLGMVRAASGSVATADNGPTRPAPAGPTRGNRGSGTSTASQRTLPGTTTIVPRGVVTPPTAITTRQLTDLLAVFVGDDIDQDVVDLLVDEYTQQWNGITTTWGSQVEELVSSHMEGRSPRALIEAGVLRQVYAMADSTTAELHKLDQQLFDDLGVLLPVEEAIEHVRHARKRDRQRQVVFGNNDGGMGRWMPTSLAHRAELMHLLDHDVLGSIDSAELNDALALYDATVGSILELLASEERRYQAAMAVEGSNSGGGDGSRWRMSPAASEIMRAHRTQRTENEEQLALANEDGLQQVLQLIDERSQRILRQRFDAVCFPEFFKDHRSGLDAVDRALRLSNLSTEQQSALNDLYLTQSAAHDEIANVMVGIMKSYAEESADVDGRGRWDLARRFRGELENETFKMEELTQKILRRLNVALSPEQLEMLGLETSDN